MIIFECLIFLQKNNQEIHSLVQENSKCENSTLHKLCMHIIKALLYCPVTWKNNSKKSSKNPMKDWSKDYFYMKTEFSHLFL